jgi:hypothetical protein
MSLQAERNALLQAYYLAETPEQKAAIQKQLIELDSKQASASAQQITDALNYPLHQMKGMLSGDPSGARWFPEGQDNPVGGTWQLTMNEAGIPSNRASQEMTSDVMGQVADVVFDPLNVVGGVAARGSKALPGAIGSFSNYIENWYGPARGAAEAAVQDNKFWKALGKVTSPETAKKAHEVASFPTGVGKWVGENIAASVQHIASPVSRAKWSELGTTSPQQRRVAGYAKTAEEQEKLKTILRNKNATQAQKEAAKTRLNALDTRARDKGVAATQYAENIAHQQPGPAPVMPEAAQELSRRSNVTRHTPFKGDNLKKAVQSHGYSVMEDGVLKEMKPDSKLVNRMTNWAQKRVEKSLGKKLGPNDRFTVRTPDSVATGGFQSDLLHKNPANPALDDAFKTLADKDGNVSPEKLYGFLNKHQKKYNDKLSNPGQKKRNSWEVIDSDETGVWIQGGRAGSAITEGGVGWIMHVDPKGNMSSMMVDLHDFAENMPLVGQLAADILPNQVVAVTPVMTKNIKTIKGGIKGKIVDEAGNVVKMPTGKPSKTGKPRMVNAQQINKGPDEFRQTPMNRDERGYPELMKEYSQAQPSMMGVLREVPILAGEGLFAQRLYENLQGVNE